MNHLSLFSGIGGIDLAAHWVGMRTVAFCEREPFPQKVLKKHWPDVPIYDDVCTLTAERLKGDGIIGPGRTIDIISGGYPCQPFSHAGKRRGKEDDRHLWPEVKRLLKEIRPRWFVGENVAGHVTLGLDDVLSDLDDIGYTAQAFIIPAASVGAPHRRDRVFIVGYTASPGFQEWRQPGITEEGTETRTGLEPESERSSKNVAHSEGDIKGRLSIRTETQDAGLECSGKDVAHSESERSREEREHQCRGPQERIAGSCETMADTRVRRYEFQKEQICTGRNGIEHNCTRTIESQLGGVLNGLSDWLDGYKWPAWQGAEQHDWEPPRVATGVKDRVGRLKALGNAVNPVQIYPIMAAIKAIDDMMHEAEGDQID